MKANKNIVGLIIFLAIVMTTINSYALSGTLTIAGEDTVKVGKTIQLTAEGILFDAAIDGNNSNLATQEIMRQDLTETCTWESSDETIATIDDKGIVTGVKEGTVTIKAEFLTKQASHKITVKKETENNSTAIENNNALSEEKALTWTDSSKIKMGINDKYYLTISGLNSNATYHLYVQNNSITPTVSATGVIDNATFDFLTADGTANWNICEYLEKSGDIYVWIYETQITNIGSVNQCIISAQKVERPVLKALGTRIECYFFSDETSTFLWEAHDFNSTRNIKLKIGKVTDNSILKAIKNGEKDALSKLLAYAKTASSVYTGTVPLGESDTITENMNITNDEYYYVYMALDDENGTYYPVEDVSLYQALIGDAVGKNLFDYLDNNFKWDLVEESTTEKLAEEKTAVDNTIANGKIPQTGESVAIYFAITIGLVVVTISAIQYKKYNIKY